ncbi:MAG: tail fiber domain-containing protein, partial [Bacteroidota bacterium]
ANYSLYADLRIAAAEFNAFSDARIKNILGQSDRQADLQALMAIQITDYQHIDTIQQGTKLHKKVIAQQVDQVYPLAVTKSITEVVPDIFQRAILKDGWIQLATNLKVGERVKIITETSKEIHEVTAVEATRFQVAGLVPDTADNGKVLESPHTTNGSRRTMSGIPTSERIVGAQDSSLVSGNSSLFVYGREVDDFHTVDYEAISMLNVSATQEQQKLIEAQRKRIEALEAENKQFKLEVIRINQLEAALEALRSKMNVAVTSN